MLFSTSTLINRLILILLFAPAVCLAQEKTFTLSGIVTDQEDERLPGAYVTVNPGNMITATNENGAFSFNLEKGEYTVDCQAVGMGKYSKKITLDKDKHLIVAMEYSDINLDQVVITAQPTMDVNSVNMGSTFMDAKTLNELPTFLGEVDVIKSIATLPGVVSGGEGAGGFYVRGGSADQNLILLDDAPVFNSSHLFGFFSVYNPDALKSYVLHRSGISAKYGSRISSILDVNLKDGNEDEFKYSIGVSPVTAKIGIDGPVSKNSSILFAARGAYPVYILKIFPDNDIKNSSGYFGDANLKYRYKINDNNQLNFSSYYSYDGFKFPSDTSYNWSNMLGSLKWNHIFNPNLVSTFSAVKSVYKNKVNGLGEGNEFTMNSGIDNTQLKADLSYLGWNQHVLDFGAGASNFIITPGTLKPKQGAGLNPVDLPEDRGTEYHIYINDEVTVSKKVSFSIGLRYSLFAKSGPEKVYLYDPNEPRSENSITDTLAYGKGEIVDTYHGPEPRASLKVSLTDNSSIKLGYSRTRQYIQLISNTAGITPVDVWKLSNRYLQPQIADQYSLGYFFLRADNAYEFSWEVYYKDLKNQIDYKDGAEILLNPYLEADLLTGSGYAYGSEWLFKKNIGKVTGWISLSYSRSFKQMVGPTEEETINNGIHYPSNFDKPINLNIFMNMKLKNPQWTFSANFNYSTGRPITAADSWYLYYGQIYANYKGRNQERMPDYHRLDLALNYNSKPSKKVQTTWSISVYNAYFRKNAYSTLFKHYYGSPPQAYKLSVIGTLVPSISYNVKF